MLGMSGTPDKPKKSCKAHDERRAPKHSNLNPKTLNRKKTPNPTP